MDVDELNRMRDLDRAAVLAAAEVACRIRPADLGRPTPCDGWTLADLLAHLSLQHQGFAAAARGEGGDLAHWAPQPPGPDPVAGFLAATAEVLTAFGADGVGDIPFRLPEISTTMEFPAALAMSFHFIDYVVHGWDLARSIGTGTGTGTGARTGLDLDQPVLAAAWAVAQQVPDTSRGRPGSPFGPKVAASPGAPLLDQIVALLGRSPNWESPVAAQAAAR